MTTLVSGKVHNVGIAQVQVVRPPDQLRTILGSCVGVALCDSASQVGGVVHVMLPSREGFSGQPAKFADSGVDLLVEKMLEAGASKSRMVAKIAGGGAMFKKQEAGAIGQRNVEAVKARLAAHSICIRAEDVGGDKGRKMVLDPATGKVTVERIGEKPKTM